MKTKIKVYYDITPTIYTGKEIVENYVRGSQITNDNSQINFGVVSQYGSCKLYDKNSVVYNRIKAGTLDSETIVPVELYLDEKLIGKYEAEIDYDIVSKQLNIELHDSLYRWAEISYSGFSIYPFGVELGATEYADLIINGVGLFNKLKEDTITLGIENNFKEIPQELQLYLEDISLGVPYLDCSTILEAWNLFCELISGALYKNENGEIEVVRYGWNN